MESEGCAECGATVTYVIAVFDPWEIELCYECANLVHRLTMEYAEGQQ